MEILNVPTVSTTEVKQSPMKVAEMAAKYHTGVYMLNRGKAVSVTLTPEQYSDLVKSQERLLDLETELQAIKRLKADDGYRISADRVAEGHIPDQIDTDDGWE